MHCKKDVVDLYGEDPHKIDNKIAEVTFSIRRCERLIVERPGEAYNYLKKVEERVRRLVLLVSMRMPSYSIGYQTQNVHGQSTMLRSTTT